MIGSTHSLLRKPSIPLQSKAARSFYGAVWIWSQVTSLKPRCSGRRSFCDRSIGLGPRRIRMSNGLHPESRRHFRPKLAPKDERSGRWGQQGWADGTRRNQDVNNHNQVKAKQRKKPVSAGRAGMTTNKMRKLEKDRESKIAKEIRRLDSTSLDGLQKLERTIKDGEGRKGHLQNHQDDDTAENWDFVEDVEDGFPDCDLNEIAQLAQDPAANTTPEPGKGANKLVPSSPRFDPERLHESKFDSADIRAVMRAVPHPVAVLTTTRLPISFEEQNLRPPYPSKVINKFRGMTISSFTTVTLSPVPIISFNIKAPSSTLDAIRMSRHFYLNILTQHERGRKIAEAFTKAVNIADSRFSEILRARSCLVPPYRDALNGSIPALRGSGVLRSLRCKILQENRAGKLFDAGLIKVGDHILVLAEVYDIFPSRPLGDKNEKKRALCYQFGKYQVTRGMPNRYDASEASREQVKELFAKCQRRPRIRIVPRIRIGPRVRTGSKFRTGPKFRARTKPNASRIIDSQQMEKFIEGGY